jgi:hypothetical protein
MRLHDQEMNSLKKNKIIFISPKNRNFFAKSLEVLGVYKIKTWTPWVLGQCWSKTNVGQFFRNTGNTSFTIYHLHGSHRNGHEPTQTNK